MFDTSDDIGMAELLLMLAIFGVGGYFVYKFLKSATCIKTPGTIPGITGASTSQAKAACTANSHLKAGGATVWTCGSDFDYLEPCGQIVTEARHNFVNYLWPWSEPVTYTDVPIACYPKCKNGVSLAAFGAVPSGCATLFCC